MAADIRRLAPNRESISVDVDKGLQKRLVK